METDAEICAYLCISVHICVYEVYIRQYLCVSELYPCIYTYICAYLCISVPICLFISKNFILREKNLIFRKKDFWS